jgi:adenylate cyclase
MRPAEFWAEGLPWGRRACKAIVVVDLVESVRLMRLAEAWTVASWRALVQKVAADVLPPCDGQLVKSLGDGLLLLFNSAPQAVAAAFQIQNLAALVPPSAQGLAVRLRVAVHLAELVLDELDVYGSGVNLAARLVLVAQPGDIVVSTEIRDFLADGLHGEIVDLGECYFKHWDEPVRVFRVLPVDHSSTRTTQSVAFLDSRPSLAVVPFSPRPGDEPAWGEALAEAIITTLSQVNSMRVVSLLSTHAFRGGAIDPAAVRRTLGAAYLVTGSYACSGHAVQFDVKLCATASGQVLWAGRRVIDGRSVFSSEDVAMSEVAARLSSEIVHTEVRRARALPLSNLESYTLHVAGVHLMHRLTRPDAERARDLFEQLAERHPLSPTPHAMLSKWHLLRAVQGWAEDRVAAARMAQACARRALDLDPEHALALSMEAIVVAQIDGNLSLALELGEEALRADPQESHAWLNLGGIHSYLGHTEAAAAMPQRAIELSPMDPARFAFDAFLAEGLLTAGRFEEAIVATQSSMRLNAMHVSSHRLLTIALALAGRVPEARSAACKLLSLAPGFRASLYQQAYPGRDLPHFPERLEALRAAGVPD